MIEGHRTSIIGLDRTYYAGSMQAEPATAGEGVDRRGARARWHLRLGLWSLALFVTMGVALEALHGLKWGSYVDVEASTRRHMWTLAHAHGSLLGLLHVALGLAIERRLLAAGRALTGASWLLLGASVALPAGFFLGGLWFHAGDPGLGILLVPPGGIALAAAMVLAALACERG
ncbi:MAG: hypothetical protein IPK80_18565 [Nannocystis sp.]|nr:hypothetical protein [Nannocystis sp.]